MRDTCWPFRPPSMWKPWGQVASSVYAGRLLCVGLCCALPFCAQAPAQARAKQARRKSVAVLALEGHRVPTPAVARLSRAVVQSLAKVAQYRPIPGKPLEEIKLVFGCLAESRRCMLGVGRSLRADMLLWGGARARGKSIVVTLKLLDIDSGKMSQSKQLVLGDAEMMTPAGAVGRTVRALLGVPRATLRVQNAPPGAEVRLDDRRVGQSDGSVFVVQDVPPGVYSLAVSKPGELAWRKVVNVQEGATVTAIVEAVAPLAPSGSGGPSSLGQAAPRRSLTGWRIAFWTSLALAVGSGGALLATGLTVQAAEREKEQVSDIDYLQQNYSDQFSASELTAMHEQGCDAPTRTDELDAACDKGERYQKASNILIGPVVGFSVLTAVLGSIYLYKAYSSPAAAEKNDGEAEVTTLRLLPTAGPNGQGAGILIQF